MSTKPSTGRRAQRGAEELDMFEHRRDYAPAAGRAKRAKQAADRRGRRAARQRGWTE